jgi:hypothetical protein
LLGKKAGLAKWGTMLPCGILPTASTANTFVIEVGRCKGSKMAGEGGQGLHNNIQSVSFYS